MSHAVLYVGADEADLDPDLAPMAEACERAGGLTLVYASGAQKALRALREHQIAVLVCAAQLASQPALELLERVQRDFPAAVRMFVCEEREPRPLLLPVAQQLLRRPLRSDEVAMLLRSAVERHLATRHIARLEQRLAETERVYALGVVAAGVAHELRNPIAAVATSLSLLRDGLASLHGERGFGAAASDVLQEMALTVADARQGIQSIADISRGMELSQRKRDSENQADLGEITRLTLTSLQGELARRARLLIELQQVHRVRGSRAKLGQVVLNLVVNAMQALPDRSARENQLRISLREEGIHVRFDVEDNARRELDSDCFAMESEDSALACLSLTSSRQIVEELGGTLRVSSSERGRCFSALFPHLSLGASTSAA